jgi:hypothetical protein
MRPFTFTKTTGYIQSLQYPQISMADKDIATRAPENDAQDDVAAVPTAVEQSVFPGDSRAQDGPSMGVRASY